jgi:hypothetical protein
MAHCIQGMAWLVVPPAMRASRGDWTHSFECDALRAGSMGGVVEAACLQPIDVIKTRLQLDSVGKYKGKPELCMGNVGQCSGGLCSCSCPTLAVRELH